MDLSGHYEWVSGLSEAVQVAYNVPRFSDLSVHSHGRIIGVNSLVLASQSDILRDIVTGETFLDF